MKIVLKGKRVLVTGGACFIGSHLVHRLVDEGCQVVVLDDLSSGARNVKAFNFTISTIITLVGVERMINK